MKLYPLLSVAFLSVSLLSCGSAPSDSSATEETRAAPTLELSSLSTVENSYCPPGFNVDSKHWICVSSTEAIGPFPPQMVNDCKKFGGGTAACEGTRWSVSFARSLRGTTPCPPGTSFDTAVRECSVGNDVYGPFRKEMVNRCLSDGGGSACQSMRWNKTFAANIKRSLGLIGQVPATQNPIAVPYFYQYNNAFEPGGTCGITSASMLINTFSAGKVNPDLLYRRYGKAQGQSPEGLAQIYRWEGLNAVSTRRGTRALIKKHIDAGRPVVVHGDWTGAGHILVITGYNSRGWIVNDPAGDHTRCYGCGVSGRGVVYEYGSRTDRLMSFDGDIWMSIASRSAFQL